MNGRRDIWAHPDSSLLETWENRVVTIRPNYKEHFDYHRLKPGDPCVYPPRLTTHAGAHHGLLVPTGPVTSMVTPTAARLPSVPGPVPAVPGPVPAVSGPVPAVASASSPPSSTGDWRPDVIYPDREPLKVLFIQVPYHAQKLPLSQDGAIELYQDRHEWLYYPFDGDTFEMLHNKVPGLVIDVSSYGAEKLRKWDEPPAVGLQKHRLMWEWVRRCRIGLLHQLIHTL